MEEGIGCESGFYSHFHSDTKEAVALSEADVCATIDRGV